MGELERSLQGRLVSQFGSRGMELSQKSQLVLYVLLKVKLASLVQSSQGRIFDVDLQLPQTDRSQPKRTHPQSSEGPLSKAAKQQSHARYVPIYGGPTPI